MAAKFNNRKFTQIECNCNSIVDDTPMSIHLHVRNCGKFNEMALNGYFGQQQIIIASIANILDLNDILTGLFYIWPSKKHN